MSLKEETMDPDVSKQGDPLFEDLLSDSIRSIIYPGLKWAGERDAKLWNVFVPPENMGEIKGAYHDAQVVLVIGRAGMGKDHLKLHLLGSNVGMDLYQVFNEDKFGQYHTVNIFYAVEKRMEELEPNTISWGKNYFRVEYREDYDQIVGEELLKLYLNKVTIFQLPDDVSSRSEAMKQLKSITSIFDRLKSAEIDYYNKHGKIPYFKLLIFMLEEHTGPKLEHIKDMQIINKAQIVFLKPYSADLLMEMYIKNVVSPTLSKLPLAVDDYFPFTEAGLRLLAQNSQGNPRRFKALIYDHLKKLRKVEEIHVLGVEDIEINIEEENKETIELELLYAGLERANARVTQYYPRVKRIIQENSHIDFKTQKQILECSVANYPHKYLDHRKISEVLSQIKERNNINTGTRKYKTLIYVDENEIFRI